MRGGGWGHKRQESALSYLRRGSWPVRGGEGEAEGETGSAARRREGDGHGPSGPPDASLYPGDRGGRGRRRRAPPGRLLGAARERGREARDAPPSLLLQALQVPAPRPPSRPSSSEPPLDSAPSPGLLASASRSRSPPRAPAASPRPSVSSASAGGSLLSPARFRGSRLACPGTVQRFSEKLFNNRLMGHSRDVPSRGESSPDPKTKGPPKDPVDNLQH